MAKRRVIKIDGGSIIADPGISIGDALRQAGTNIIPASVVAEGEIIRYFCPNRRIGIFQGLPS